MIAKYPNDCRYCRKPIEVNRDEYDPQTKTSYHIECVENQPPTPEQFALAEQLGFIEYRPDMAADGLLRRMLPRSGGASAGGTTATPRGNESATLFE